MAKKQRPKEKRNETISSLSALKSKWLTITQIAKALKCNRRGVYRPVRTAVKQRTLKRIKVGTLYYFAAANCRAAAPVAVKGEAGKGGKARSKKVKRVRKAKPSKKAKRSRVASAPPSAGKPVKKQKGKAMKTTSGNGTTASAPSAASEIADAGKKTQEQGDLLST